MTDQSTVATAHGFYRRKHRLRAVFQSAAFMALVSGYMAYNALSVGLDDEEEFNDIHSVRAGGRSLSAELRSLVSCSEMKQANPGWFCLWYAIGVLYMFLALAIVCDEFFVPALEEMASSRRLNLSMDVAGATLMAAGGSAPELFSSLFGTFAESDIGIGTILGSAVFNVLFVIAMCSIFSKEVLQLTWWPLFRDSSYYAVGLIVLVVFVGVVTPEEVHLWEAVVLLIMYLGYIIIMWQNENIYRSLTGKELERPEEDEEEEPDKKTQETFVEEGGSPNGDGAERPALQKQPSSSSAASAVGGLQAGPTRQSSMVNFRWQGTFRAGILKLLRHPETWITTGGVGIVAKIAGDADQVFSEIDANGDGHIDKEELRSLFQRLECRVGEAELEEVYKELSNADGVITKEDFDKWYITSAELIRSQVRHVFNELDTNKSGTLDHDELKALLVELDPNVTDAEVHAAIESMGQSEEVTFEEFESWYETSMIYERQKAAIEEDMEGIFESLKPPRGEGVGSWIQYIIVLPLVVVMAFTIPDVRRPGWGKWCYVSFVISIAWIGGFSYLMVDWAERIGNTIGIPAVVMGLTVLAAGTSVPDLLSSVIVARRGAGDMAVSSSIGSNIFDILVGLPIPWIIFTAWPSTPGIVKIGAKNIWISISILVGMLVFVIVAVHCQGWRLTKTLGAMMMVFYVAFLVVSIWIETPFVPCTNP